MDGQQKKPRGQLSSKMVFRTTVNSWVVEDYSTEESVLDDSTPVEDLLPLNKDGDHRASGNSAHKAASDPTKLKRIRPNGVAYRLQRLLKRNDLLSRKDERIEKLQQELDAKRAMAAEEQEKKRQEKEEQMAAEQRRTNELIEESLKSMSRRSRWTSSASGTSVESEPPPFRAQNSVPDWLASSKRQENGRPLPEWLGGPAKKDTAKQRHIPDWLVGSRMASEKGASTAAHVRRDAQTSTDSSPTPSGVAGGRFAFLRSRNASNTTPAPSPAPVATDDGSDNDDLDLVSDLLGGDDRRLSALHPDPANRSGLYPSRHVSSPSDKRVAGLPPSPVAAALPRAPPDEERAELSPATPEAPRADSVSAPIQAAEPKLSPRGQQQQRAGEPGVTPQSESVPAAPPQQPQHRPEEEEDNDGDGVQLEREKQQLAEEKAKVELTRAWLDEERARLAAERAQLEEDKRRLLEEILQQPHVADFAEQRAAQEMTLEDEFEELVAQVEFALSYDADAGDGEWVMVEDEPLEEDAGTA